MNIEFVQKAWNLLGEKGLDVKDKIIINELYKEATKDEWPFISTEYEKGKVKYYFSKFNQIRHLRFESINEVILVNAIYQNIKDKFEPNEFIQMIKFTFKILGIESAWSK